MNLSFLRARNDSRMSSSPGGAKQSQIINFFVRHVALEQIQRVLNHPAWSTILSSITEKKMLSKLSTTSSSISFYDKIFIWYIGKKEKEFLLLKLFSLSYLSWYSLFYLSFYFFSINVHLFLPLKKEKSLITSWLLWILSALTTFTAMAFLQ